MLLKQTPFSIMPFCFNNFFPQRRKKEGKFPPERRRGPTLRNNGLDFYLKIPWGQIEVITFLSPSGLESCAMSSTHHSLVLGLLTAARKWPLTSPESRLSAGLLQSFSLRPCSIHRERTPTQEHTQGGTHARHGSTINEKKINLEQDFPIL